MLYWSFRTVGEVSTACDFRSVIYDSQHWLVSDILTIMVLLVVFLLCRFYSLDSKNDGT